MINQKLDEISQLVRSIKSKMDIVVSSTVSLRELNYRIEALLISFKAYACKRKHTILDNTLSISNTQSIKETYDSGEHTAHQNAENECFEKSTLSTPSTYTSKTECLNEYIVRMTPKFSNSKLVINSAIKIASLLYSNTEGMMVEEIIKGAGVPRYRCIDILNTMLRTEPPLASKKFCKGFVYSIVLL
ncbi:hypothetical protein OCOL_001538 [Ordospora colligata]|uniref:Uncharacterized protein n=1 Tax=Ordospora colligata OC4 TaxID=1354746 RepID=A0A0B2UGW5_9MICR|nr:uncharacterized protein M896_021240 [Ordospora colligata OC4]KHN70286.1 hypothetical protein M896_021240 [Ordospora colligata OC4]TBU16830.1 hypothetical protein CWI41_021250 [Ordospora colligata]TBU16938.1 hypothetical protein CWI40_021250 [Ordospora colligata]